MQFLHDLHWLWVSHILYVPERFVKSQWRTVLLLFLSIVSVPWCGSLSGQWPSSQMLLLVIHSIFSAFESFLIALRRLRRNKTFKGIVVREFMSKTWLKALLAWWGGQTYDGFWLATRVMSRTNHFEGILSPRNHQLVSWTWTKISNRRTYLWVAIKDTAAFSSQFLVNIQNEDRHPCFPYRFRRCFRSR